MNLPALAFSSASLRTDFSNTHENTFTQLPNSKHRLAEVAAQATEARKAKFKEEYKEIFLLSGYL